TGAYQGKYDISPGINTVGIDLYFLGERYSEQHWRLGNGTISRRIDWYDPKRHQVYTAPSDVKDVFDVICKRINTGKKMRAGGRTYYFLKGALKKIKTGCTPPFDFMEWPKNLMNIST